MTFSPSPEQQAFYDAIKNTNDNIVLEARAGSGKTSSIIGGLDYLHGRTFLGAFNKKISDELKTKVGRRGNVFVQTFHAAGFGYLRNHYDNINVDGNKVRIIGKEILETKLEREYLSKIVRLISIAKNNGVGISSKAPIGNSTWRQIANVTGIGWQLPSDRDERDELYNFASKLLGHSNKIVNTIDFDDMIYLALLNDCRGYTYSNVIIDEAQDVNATKLMLADRMLDKGGRVIATGDSLQNVYSFTGTLPDSMNKIQKYYKATKLPLTVTWRCPVSVTKEAQKFASDIRHRDGAPNGIVETIKFTDMMKKLKDVDYTETVLVCRTNRPLVSTALKLIQEDIPCYVEGKEIGAFLLKKWRIQTIKPFIKKVEEFKRKEMMKAREENNESIAAWLEDECGVVTVCAYNALDRGMTTMQELRDFMAKLFSKTDGICLSSIHKAKGLEWDNVYLLFRDELMPSKWANTPEQKKGEKNLEYVAVTRSKEKLFYVNDDMGIL